MSLLVAIVLALFFLPEPWGLVAVGVALAIEVGEAYVLLRWSQRRRAQVGAEALIDAEGIALETLEPEGQVRVAGEIWSARSSARVPAGGCVRVAAVDGLTLVVEPCV
jgi:membrane protein implicated in regulation of membrane protease activity